MEVAAQRLALAAALALALTALPVPRSTAAAEPPGFEHLHTYAEVGATIEQLVADHPDIARAFSIGRSYEGRELWAVKISDNVALDEDEPEVAIGALIHARERLGNEMAMYLLRELTDGYTTDERIRRLVDEREIYILPMLNPDGAEYDIYGGAFKSWRKNRQPIPGSSAIGIDLNRQFSYQWRCCGGGSDRPRHEMYRGWAPWVAPEAVAYRDFVNSRVVGGRQQLTAFLNLHTEGRLVLWPYAYTYTDLPATMTADDHATFVAIGRQMAAGNGYRARQGSDLYIIDGDHDDWLYHRHRIFALTIEMTRTALRHYPTRAEVAADTALNRESVVHFLELADCPYRAAGLAATHCGPLGDDFEIYRGWRVDPFGTDTATAGRWQRAHPRKTSDATGVKQRGAPASGRLGLVTGAAGGRVAANDVDGGVTSALSPAIELGAGSWRLSFSYTFAHDRRATPDDMLRVSVVAGGEPTVVWVVRGAPSVRNAAWRRTTVDLREFSGRRVRILVEAADGGTGNVLEAALDDVRVFRSP